MANAPAFALSREEAWPALPYPEWADTLATLHMWTQVVGKVRLALSPRVNHWWEVPLYVSARGLTTSSIPYRDGIFEVNFDFIDHELLIATSGGEIKTLALAPRSVADFYKEFMALLASLGIDVKIWPMPVEIPNPIRFDQDTTHASYDRQYAHRFWRILVTVDTICKEFRAEFIGKASPVQFFWGSFDLATTRFSGRRAPERPGADPITKEAYSHEETSAGWWPGSESFPNPAFYAYAAPQPAGYADRKVLPAQAHYDAKLSEFLLLYDDVRNAADPRAALWQFLETTYVAGADLGHWQRSELERGK